MVPAVSIAGSCLCQRGIHKVQEQKQNLFREIEGVAARTLQCMWAAREGGLPAPRCGWSLGWVEAGALIEYPNGVGFGCGENMSVPQGIFRMAAQVHHGKAGALSWHGTGKGFVCFPLEVLGCGTVSAGDHRPYSHELPAWPGSVLVWKLDSSLNMS